jgi:hypothetical protein
LSGRGLAARGLAVVRGAGLAALAVPALLLVALCLYTCAVLPFFAGFVVFATHSGPKRLLAGPATWRDLLWLAVNGCGGFLVALAPAGLTVTGIVSFCLLAAGQPGLYVAVPMAARLAISAVILAGGLWVAPACLRGYGRLAAVFLAPSKSTSLADRVGHLE